MPYSDLDETRLRRLIEIGTHVVSTLDPESLLALIVEDACLMTGARYGALGVLDEAHGSLDRFITYGVDQATKDRIGALPSGRGVLGVLIKDPRPLRLHSVAAHPDSFGFPPSHPPMGSFLGVPIVVDGLVFGHLYLTEKVGGDFDEADQSAVETLAIWSAIAIANARAGRQDRLRAAIAASEHERRRWARELHDETLQGLGGLRILLSAALRSDDRDQLRESIEAALEQISLEITGLRGLITELRPAALDSIGLEAALESLANRAAGTSDFNLEIDMDFSPSVSAQTATEQEIAAYRLVQEALSNAAKHARASLVQLSVRRTPEAITIEISDDGDGFDRSETGAGFGLVGMRERVALTNGTISIETRPGAGTTIKASLPHASVSAR